ncbi:hypothetical protein MOC02_22445 [Bacillus inaquosorum]|uniref:hypothetical protein n=1 Tax=Bacillus inaquosorum TaxID=483913 RepID=UPI0022802CC5|nr:hypothetical protein [Bacillus inaquosorum]MCY8085976.1 hypothetical protein [Bacillus inaquosorum]MCY8705401.1 hypothetical protein [Bacillus inaquosorum]
MGQAKKDQEKREHEQFVARKVSAEIAGAKLCENCGEEFYTKYSELICEGCYKDLLANA